MLELRLRGVAPDLHAARLPDATPFRLLVRLFLRRFLDNDILAPRGDTPGNVGILLALLAAPGIFSLVWLLLAYSGPFLTPSERLLMALDHKYRFIAVSMVLAALAAALEWDALSLDARDAAILGPLPMPPRRLLAARLAALGLFLLALSTAVNLAPAVAFPAISMSLVPIGLPHLGWLMIVHALVCLAAACAGFLFVVAVRSLVLLIAGARLLKRVSAVVQALLVFVFAGLFLLLPLLPADVLSLVESPSREAFRYPPMWFLGAHERATARGLFADPRLTADSTWTFWERRQLKREWNRGPEVWAHPLPLYRTEAAARSRYISLMPTLDGLAATGAATFGGLAAAASLLYCLGEVRQRRRDREASLPSLRRPAAVFGASARRALDLIPSSPASAATMDFTLQTLSRSGPHRLRVAAALALGCALVVESLIGQVEGRASYPVSPTPAFLALEYLLAFFLLAGVRRALDVPAALEASWIFRLAHVRDATATRAGVRRAIVAGVILPLFALLSAVHLLLWGAAAAALHLVVGILQSTALAECLLFGSRTVPFAAACPSGDPRLRWPTDAVRCLLFVLVSANLEAIAHEGLAALAVVTAIAVGSIAGLRTAAARQPAAARQLVFDEQEGIGLRLGRDDG